MNGIKVFAVTMALNPGTHGNREIKIFMTVNIKDPLPFASFNKYRRLR